jgi:hypothetical protein
VNVVLTDVEAAVESAPPVEHVTELVVVSATEIVSGRNVEMMDVTLEISAISVDLNKFVVQISDVLVPAHPTAETLTELNEFVVTTAVLDHAVNAHLLLDKISVAETDNVFADQLVTKMSVDLTDVEDLAEPVLEMPLVSTDSVLTPFPDVVEMVSVEPVKILAVATLIVVDAVLTESVKRPLERLNKTVSRIVLPHF